MLLKKRREHEQAPDAVDDAGNTGEQLDGDADRAAQPHRAQLGQKHRDEQADRHRDQHGDERGDDRAVDRRDRAEFLGDRIPDFFVEEADAERAQGRQRSPNQRDDDTAEDDENRGGSRAGDGEMRRRPTAGAAEPSPDRPARRRDARTLQRYVNHGPPPGRLHPGSPGPFPPLWRATQAACLAAAQAASLSARGHSERAPSAAPFQLQSSDQLVIAKMGLPLASLISLAQVFSTSLHDVGRHRHVVEFFRHLAAVLVGPGEELQRLAGRGRILRLSCRRGSR